MRYLLDSDVFIGFLWQDWSDTQLVESLVPAGVAISIVTYMESFQGTLRQPDPDASQIQFRHFLEEVPVLPFTRSTAELCAEMRHELLGRGRRVRDRLLDLMIAATAIERGLILVTRNQADYRDIPGLQIN